MHVMENRNLNIEWRPIPLAEGWDELASDAAVRIDVAKLDLAWRCTDQYIVPGGANGQDKRYRRAGEWFAENGHSTMLVAGLVSEHVEFIDGRHRFAWLRDHDVTTIELQVPFSQAKEFSDRFGCYIVM